MQIENKVQEIATTTAMTAAQDFLSTLPPEASQAVCPNFLSSLSEDVQADLQAVIHSRLQWSLQALKAEMDEQQRLQELQAAEPEPLQTEPTLQPLVQIAQPQTKSRSTKPKKVLGLRKTLHSSAVPAAVVEEETLVKEPEAATPLQDAQLELPGVWFEPEPLKPRRHRRSAPEEMSKEDIFKAHSLSPTDFAPRPAGAVRRRRRTSIAMG